MSELKVEDLPLEKKLEVLKKYYPIDFYEEGRFIDGLDTVNNWCVATISQIEGKKITIHFDGWSNKWDATVPLNSFKILPFRK